MKKVGLTLGKFAPMHKGHEFMIETALEEMDELIILIYDTTVTKIPLSVRSSWIKKNIRVLLLFSALMGQTVILMIEPMRF